jgi:hypothetical protein
MQIIWENLGAKLFYIFLNGVFLSGLHNILWDSFKTSFVLF